MVMRSQMGSEPGDGGDGGDVGLCQYDLVPVAETSWPRGLLSGEVFVTASTESTKSQNTSSLPGKLKRSRSPGTTSPGELNERPAAVDPTLKLVATTECDRRASPAINESAQLPGERARAMACDNVPSSKRNRPGNGKKLLSALFTSATRITQQRRPPLRKNALTAEGRQAYTGWLDCASMASTKSLPKISSKCAISSTITGRCNGPLAENPTNAAMSMRTSASFAGGATTSN